MRTGLETKVTGQTLTASEWDDVPTELKSLIEGAGIALSAGDLAQVEKAVAQYVGTSQFYNTAGSASAIALTAVGSKEPPIALQHGLLVRWRPGQTCPGGVITLTAGALAAKALTDEAGQNLAAGVYDTAKDVKARYDSGGDRFQFIPESPVPQGRNLIENSDFIHWSHLAEQDYANTDVVTSACTRPTGGTENYDIPIDRWHLIMGNGSGGADVDDAVSVKRQTNRSGGQMHASMRAACVLNVVTANRKFGIIQNIEARKCGEILNEPTTVKCSLSFRAMAITSPAGHFVDIRAAVISSTAAADNLTVSPVDAWGANAATPTLVAGQVYENTPVALSAITQGSYTYYTIPDIDVTATSVNNLRVMIWVNDPTNTAVGDLLFISQVKLEPQEVCSPWEATDPDIEEMACRRQYRWLGAHSATANTQQTRVGIGTVAYSGGQDDYVQFLCMVHPPLARAPDKASPNGFGIDLLGTFSFIAQTGDHAQGGPSVTAANIVVNHADYGQGTESIRGRAHSSGDFSNEEASYLMAAGGSVDTDGFFNDGIHVRTKI